MPKVAHTREQKIEANMQRTTRKLRSELKDCGIKQKDLAEAVGLEKSAISKQFCSGHMTFEVFIAAQMMLKGEI